jgi:hypothetical protein
LYTAMKCPLGRGAIKKLQNNLLARYHHSIEVSFCKKTRRRKHEEGNYHNGYGNR